MRHIAVIIFAVLSVLIVEAKKPSGPDLTALNRATAKYRSAKLVQMSVKKIVKSELTGKESQYKGKIFLSSGLFRLANTEPEKSLLIYDGSTVWNEQEASADFPGPPQVTKKKLAGKDKSQTLFATLLTKDPVTKNFKILSHKKEGNQSVYEAEPLNSDLAVKALTIKINTQKDQVSEISFKDDLGNLTIMKFSEPKFRKSFDKALFQYKPPKGAQVTEI